MLDGKDPEPDTAFRQHVSTHARPLCVHAWLATNSITQRLISYQHFPPAHGFLPAHARMDTSLMMREYSFSKK